jgi:hypothetical protein
VLLGLVSFGIKKFFEYQYNYFFFFGSFSFCNPQRNVNNVNRQRGAGLIWWKIILKLLREFDVNASDRKYHFWERKFKH